MVSTFFLTLAVYYFVNVENYNDWKRLILVGTALGISIITRYVHILALIPIILFLPAYFSNRMKLKVDGVTDVSKKRSYLISVKSRLWILVPIFFLLVGLIIANWVLFTEPFYVGYLMKNYLPGGSQDGPSGISYYIFQLFSLDRLAGIGELANLFFLFSDRYILLFGFGWIGLILINVGRFRGLVRTDKQYSRLTFVFLALCGVFLLYYGLISGLLWVHGDVIIFLSQFRYLLPIYALGIIFSADTLVRASVEIRSLWNTRNIKKISRRDSEKLTSLIIILVICGLVTCVSVDYSGPYWLTEFDNRMEEYYNDVVSKNLIPPNSTILYGSRNPQLLLMPDYENYHWFSFISIPRADRFSETNRVVDELLDDDTVVLVFSSIYDLPEETEMLEFLRSNYNLIALQDTLFARNNGIFYDIQELSAP
jgi:hypothetical protein